MTKAEEINRKSSMFVSKTKRNISHEQMVKHARQNKGLDNVCYDTKAGTIEETMKRKAEASSNSLIASLNLKNSTTMAFSSNAPRFNAKVMDEETYIGPGYYEQKSCFEKSRSTLATKNQTIGQAS